MPPGPPHDAPPYDSSSDPSAIEAGEIANNLTGRPDLPSDLRRDPKRATRDLRDAVDDRARGDHAAISADLGADLEIADPPSTQLPSPEPSPEQDTDEDEVWFEAEALAEASRVELGGAVDARPSLLQPAPDHASLLRELAAEGLSLGRLPGWPGAGEAGQGWGEELDAIVGRLQRGDLVLLTAGVRGAGRSSLLAQLADGLALRGTPEEPLTPTLLCVDEAPSTWRARSFARWSGRDPQRLIESWGDRDALAEALADFGGGLWSPLASRQRFAPLELLADAQGRARLITELARWRESLAEASGRELETTWPVLVVDPVEQLGPAPRLLDALADLAEREGLLVLAAADEPEPTSLAATRALDRRLALRLRLEPRSVLTAEGSAELRTLELEVVHRRLGARGRASLRWRAACGRFEAE